ncbi:hypothetical protein H257_14365 [Aphanomyces astaci]|uniref:Uncharacterized protein n=1 Tax=Aphanomyces astaci TaxID=112090 RepID=W4FR87_APHAT|nr:hypothetical protein H257_14365 [Aphanomyces astaci]ETV69997.1 hypothetical protein H257_14365 [Aphanomyces astaci]|eukprot:XP_009840440.1 hypothetical protein H257_14365 [Aphanomyces astaci]
MSKTISLKSTWTTQATGILELIVGPARLMAAWEVHVDDDNLCIGFMRLAWGFQQGVPCKATLVQVHQPTYIPIRIQPAYTSVPFYCMYPPTVRSAWHVSAPRWPTC